LNRILHALLVTTLALTGAVRAGEALPDLAAIAGEQAQRFLPPDQAFLFDPVVEGAQVTLQIRIHDGYYLYRDKTKVALDGDPTAPVALEMPMGEEHEDEFFGKQRVFRGDVTWTATVPAGARGALKVQYMGCADAGLCYPPQVRLVALDAGGSATAGAPSAATGGGPAQSEQDRLAEVIRSGSILVLLATFFVLGLALTFTPCVLPMIPILSGIIAGQGARATPARAFGLSLAYVLAMALTYTVAGVLAGLFGQNLQAALQDPWVLGSFALVFVALSFSMFGYYELQMPAAVQEKLTAWSNRAEGGTFAGAAIMGLLSALIVGPCVTAPLVGALIYIGQSGDPVRGGLALFALSLGMGVPLLLVGTSLGGLLPRAGAWMEKVKQVFGVLLLATALWFARTLLPEALVMVGWGALSVGLAAVLGAFEPLGAQRGAALVRRVVATLLLLWGAAILVGAASGGRNPLQPLDRLGAGAPAHALSFQRIKSVADLEAAVATSAAAGKPVMFDFYADWCVSCKEMEAYTFPEPAVQAALAGVTLLQADVTANDAVDQQLMQRFGIFGPPAILFFGADGRELPRARVVGFVPADAFAAHLTATLRTD
jgi:thiol:disulfide interchange protein DsbD